MADYWKSTPKYWCKHCSMYVVDTKVSRVNHDATGKHQSAVKRALRDLHRDHERQEREKDRAKREVERLNGLVGESSGQSPSTTSKPGFKKVPPPESQAPQGPPAVARDQLEQLVELGVSIPDQFRGELAMAGDWTVTETRIIEDQETAKKNGSTRAVGVRKRPHVDGEDDTRPGGHSEFDKLDVDAAVQGLFKKPRTWGRDSRTVPGDSADGDLDSLLSNALKPKTEDEAVKREAKQEIEEEVKEDIKLEDMGERVKTEAGEEAETKAEAKAEAVPEADTTLKREDTGGLDLPPALEDTKPEEPAIVFKKRKSKASRQK
ncbi:u1 zinc finger domain-containing protein [Ophiostoma piceae UAMH 11346]|uniref:U1 zinc finger domain-containing protein n=1 Tax=Ophiostoma piceae (strain UAMH 11346) TaxID=1262450 RepID=S3C5F2_OPHP1|nr:u1 zinc finger domain-containing protein [Ophiostoma piceae UAMH 11346]